MNIDGLIKELSPLYNSYKKNKSALGGTASLQIMWDIGDVLQKFIFKNNIPPHKLFWTVYGNAEGKQNVTRNSYITREFQGKAHRIRKIFSSKEEINQLLPNLKSFICFREAMPFFDNEKYKFAGKEKQELFELLNSKKSSKEILRKIKELQKEKIGIKNSRTQRLGDLESEKNIFVNFYNSAYKLLKESNYQNALTELTIKDTDFFSTLSKNTSCLSNEGLKKYPLEIPESLSGILKDYSLAVNTLLDKEDAKARRRFRRLIPPERIMRLADIIYAFTSEKNYSKFISLK